MSQSRDSLSSPPWPPPGIGALFALRAAGGRWPQAARAAVCTGGPVLAAWVAGDIAVGLPATIGAFTALYGVDRPYLSRARYLAVIAVSLALSVTLGIWAAAAVWAGVLAVALIAMVATLVCNALDVGPPGAYMFALACAVGTGLHAGRPNPVSTGLLVLAGGAFAWLVSMSGVVIRPRGPERARVADAGRAVEAFLEAIGTPRQDAAQHEAALHAYGSWTALVSQQPFRARPAGELSRLRALNRDLHLLFAEGMRVADRGVRPTADEVALAGQLTTAVRCPSAHAVGRPEHELVFGRPSALALLRQAVAPEGHTLLVVVRVGVAALVAGVVGAGLGLAHAYWAIAAAVLVLHQGLDWTRTWHKTVQRVAGTGAGLALAAGLLSAHPTGLWLVAALMVLQFAIEMSVVRNYALAVVFITPMALLIASAGGAVPAVGQLVFARGLDTVVGCAVALIVFRLLAGRGMTGWVPQAVADTLDAVAATVVYLPAATVTTSAAQAARHDLQRRAIALMNAYERDVGGPAGQRRAAERAWPAVAATQRLAYRTLNACWAMEQAEATGTAGKVARSLLTAAGATTLRAAVTRLSTAVRAGEQPPLITEPLPPLGEELLTLSQMLPGGVKSTRR